MALGDTYVWCPYGTIDHLWIVISNAAEHDGNCVVINLTESSHAEHSFILKQGQHSFIYKDSDVNFGDAFLTSENILSAKCKIGAARPHDPMAKKIVMEIIARARSPHPAFPPHLIKYLP